MFSVSTGVASKLLREISMLLQFKSKRILIPDVPPPTIRSSNQGLVIAGIGVFCASVAVAAALFVFLSV
jgi:hypothetical protein